MFSLSVEENSDLTLNPATYRLRRGTMTLRNTKEKNKSRPKFEQANAMRFYVVPCRPAKLSYKKPHT